MRLDNTLVLALAAAGLASPVYFDLNNKREVGNITFVPCTHDSADPICKLVRQPSTDVISTIIHPNGTQEIKRNLYTREQLRDIRVRNSVTSVEFKPGQEIQDRSAEFIAELTKRETAPPVCYTETQTWFDQHEWGYWFQVWKQVGSCFYCDVCTDAIQTSFSVTQTWTTGLSVTFAKIIQANFGFSWGQTEGLSETRTCSWNNVQSGCHSIWYQPLMSYHNGYPNYQTHTHCYAASGYPASDSYYDHNYVYANVNQAGNNGINQGNLGCDSGCQGSDHRQCQYANNGGSLWPNPN
ncbi:hypothetical protein BR93DRAFT_989890 [Coniochaeta sp. PMI_546]|nr:hypothetical protein BR93DRAFT_989890 [Coniochaeta sp. PMI_546]